jgi:radical SAM protein with 4Fe4S-binding SPASM domain
MSIETIDTAVAKIKQYRNRPFKIDLFGGEPLLQLDLVEYVLQKAAKDPQIFLVNIPNNGWVASTYPEEIKRLYKKYGKLNLSFSVDGPYVEEKQRPSLPEYKHLKLDYDNLFKLYGEGYLCGFHPMVYAPTVHTLFDTFKFFVDNVRLVRGKDHPVGDDLFLLQVRNGGTWHDDRINTLIEESWKCINYIQKENINLGETQFNLFRTPGMVKRGLTCSFQTQLTVAWDGSIYPCHRLIYPDLKIGSIHDLENMDCNKFLFFYYFHRNNNLICHKCKFPINQEYCAGGCLGAQLEFWGDLAIPIPDVCKMLLRYQNEVRIKLPWNKCEV